MQPSQSNWQADLDDFFASVQREDKTYLDNLQRQHTFYTEVAQPAMQQAAEALRRHERHCETGMNQNRVYLIVRRPEGTVEFQYAVFAESRIEAVTPYIHCWFEEDEYADELPGGRHPEAKKPEEGKESEQPEEGDDEPKDEKADDKKPTRTKTIEVLSTWTDNRQLESVTQDELLADFTAHYKEAVSRLRTHLHNAPSQ